MNVGELKKLLEKYEDDVEIIASSSNYEMSGSRVKARIIETKCSVIRENFRDDFDGIRYTSLIYKNDKNGKTMLWVVG